jgi:hypothetical protein
LAPCRPRGCAAGVAARALTFDPAGPVAAAAGRLTFALPGCGAAGGEDLRDVAGREVMGMEVLVEMLDMGTNFLAGRQDVGFGALWAVVVGGVRRWQEGRCPTARKWTLAVRNDTAMTTDPWPGKEWVKASPLRPGSGRG